jgi:hypothetical protein
VCGQASGPAAPGAACGQCGWLLYLPLRAGPVTADMRRDFDSRLRAARRDQAERDVQALGAALRDLIGDLRPGTTSAVIDISADEITVTTAYLDSAGSPQVRGGGGVMWTSLLRMLDAAEQARYSQLADGIGGLGDESIASLLRDRIPPVRDDRVLVICRPAGWRILEAAATALAARPRARALRLSDGSGISARQELADLAAKAPLRHPYRLMTVAVDSQTGAVALRPCQLFAVGDGPGAEARLTLRRMPGDMADTTLAIFADTGNPRGADGAAADPLALYSVPMPPGPAAQLRAVLDGPGRVRIVEPTGAVPHPDTWAQVRGQIPNRVTTAAAPVDLVCAIDLAGTRDTVRRRVSFVRDLVQLLGAEFPGGRRLRVGVVTCTDHVFGTRRDTEYESVTSASELGPAAEALAWLDRTTGADIRYPLCAPVEDLLAESLRLLVGSKRARRVSRLLTVAGRRPHPYPQLGDRRLPCPHRLVWQHLMDQLTRQAGVRCAVVADALPGGAERAEWCQLGPAGQRELPDATARQVAEDLGLLAAQAQRIPLPLTDEPEGATL